MADDSAIKADCAEISKEFTVADYDGLDDEVERIKQLNKQGIVEPPREVDDDDPIPLL